MKKIDTNISLIGLTTFVLIVGVMACNMKHNIAINNSKKNSDTINTHHTVQPHQTGGDKLYGYDKTDQIVNCD